MCIRDRLSYQPNTAARALVRGRSGLIGIVTGSGAFYGPRSAHQGVSAAARKAGYSVTSVELDDITEATLAAAVEDLSRLGVEGPVSYTHLDVYKRQTTTGSSPLVRRASGTTGSPSSPRVSRSRQCGLDSRCLTSLRSSRTSRRSSGHRAFAQTARTSSSTMPWQTRSSPCVKWSVTWFSHMAERTALSAVSYTHLDVYKRQPSHSSSRGGGRRNTPRRPRSAGCVRPASP